MKRIIKPPYQYPLMHLSTLPYPRYANKPSNIIDYTLPVPLIVEQWTVPAGITVKLQTTKNFGFCIIPEGVMPKGIKRIFSY